MLHNIVHLENQKMVFFLTPKAANTSIKTALKEAIRPDALSTRLHDIFPRIDPTEAYKLSQTKGYFSIGVTRNPATRVFSCWKNKIIGSGSGFKFHLGFEKGMPLDDFVNTLCNTSELDLDIHLRPMSISMMFEDRVIPDLTFKSENLERTWKMVQHITKSQCGIALPALTRKNVSPETSATLSVKHLQMLYDKYEQDFAIWRNSI